MHKHVDRDHSIWASAIKITNLEPCRSTAAVNWCDARAFWAPTMIETDMAVTAADLFNGSFEANTEHVPAATSDYESSSVDASTRITPIQDLSHLFAQTFSGMAYKQCTEWQSATQHVYYHIANAFLLLAFLIPYKPLYSFLCARCAFTFACVFMIMFNYLIECSLDGVIWFSVYLAVNVVYLLVLIYQLRPIRFEKEIEQVSGG